MEAGGRSPPTKKRRARLRRGRDYLGELCRPAIPFNILRWLEAARNHHVAAPGVSRGESDKGGGSYPERSTKTGVLLDVERFLGKLHFSLCLRPHKSLPLLSCTISTSPSVQPSFSMP